MTTQTYSATLQPNVSVPFPGGRFFFVKSAVAAISITTRGNTGAPVRFESVGAGLRFGPVPLEQAWRYLDVMSTTAQNVELIISDDAEVDVANTVNVAGAVSITTVPSTTIATPARIALNTGADVLIAAANASRRSLTIQSPSTNTDNFNIGPSGSIGTARGLELEPGVIVNIVTSAAVYGRAATGTPSAQVLEET